MQFKVPQFLDIEDKIFGPFTFSQFVYLAGGGGLAFVLYKLLGFLLGFIPIIAVLAFSLALTFYRPNSKPFVSMLESGFKYFLQDKLYIWKRKTQKVQREESRKKDEEKKEEEREKELIHPKHAMRLGESKLRDLAWSLDVLDLGKEQKQ
ncbi:MAG: PrgI family protein [Candidatus Pacebacteria bacterium]|nr:PrgI family protein [Candidatus Paceibacterota bacterium]